MLKAISVIAIVLAVGIAAVLVFALTKPDTFRVERSLAVKAPADAIYPLVADFHRWTNGFIQVPSLRLLVQGMALIFINGS